MRIFIPCLSVAENDEPKDILPLADFEPRSLRNSFAESLAHELQSRLVDGEGSRIVRENLDNPLSLLQHF